MRTPALLAALALALAGCPADEDETRCPEGETACGGVCFDLQTSPVSCGTCLHTCAEGASCVGGACRCPDGWIPCDGACVDPLADAANCGACGEGCGLGTCAAGACACTVPAVDCGTNPACVDLGGDPAHCGGCGVGCLERGVCVDGVCGCPPALPQACPTYCASLASPSDCGACGNACAAGGVCSGGACDCPGAEVVCGAVPGGSPGACVDTATDEAHCGACARPCATGATCTASACRCPAAAPDLCGVTGSSPGACVSRQTDEANCGACGNACASGATCLAGACCPASQPVCGDRCCAGDQCCDGGCQPPHSNGLGQSYFAGCDLPYAPEQTTLAAALLAADAWSPGANLNGTTVCGPLCLGRQTANQCAVWCYGDVNGLRGKVAVNTTSSACAVCPSAASPSWD